MNGNAPPVTNQNPDSPMLNLTHEQITAYLQRSYGAVDGLWFMKVEEHAGFDNALDIDEKVWQVMPKIQARVMKSFLGKDGGLAALRECFEAKLTLDGFEYEIVADGKSFAITISRCPWYDKLVKSNRTHLANKIRARICTAEYSGWAAEFGCTFAFRSQGRICSGCKDCGLRFDA
jgi:hypothetical protein